MGKAAREARRELNRAAERENRMWPQTLMPFEPSFRGRTAAGLRRVWRSRRFLVMEFVTPEAGDVVRLSVQRVDHAAFRTDALENPISWDDLMACKAQVGYGDAWAVEVYPADGHVVDLARMRHLWLVPAESLPFAWRNP